MNSCVVIVVEKAHVIWYIDLADSSDPPRAQIYPVIINRHVSFILCIHVT